jgi:hypothetical protein
MDREYRTIRALRRGEIIDFEGIKLKMDIEEDGKEKKIEPGDLYVAERNTRPKLLTAREVVMSECGCCINFICPTTPDYAFDGSECVKVIEA